MTDDSVRASTTRGSMHGARAEDPTLAGLDSHGAGSSSPETLARGTVIGRYVVLSTVGTGGMGVVHAAYDPELGRKVALKLLRSRAGPASSQGPARLVREARALARLSHPNVVTIHDVGTHGDEVWLAMEFVEGRTLGAWLVDTPPWSEPLRVLVDAGRGLAAAHDAGLVHRDFKPANVMVGDDGRVRVMDLGLARSTGVAPRSDDEPIEATGRLESHGAALDVTHAGAVVGTPAYMAPEQLAGRAIDARADQFSWCATAWEAMFGERAFAGETALELAGNVLAGRRRPAPRSRVPRWIRRALDRGLAIDPERRWPTMTELLDALARGQVRARVRRVSAVLGGIALAGLGVYGWTALDRLQRTGACEAAGDRIALLWNDDARARVHDGILATGVVFAASTNERLMPWLDRHAAEWRDTTTDVCLATELRGQWNESTYERAAWCLDDRWLRLESLVAALSEADPDVARGAVAAVASMPASGACSDTDRLARQAVPPPDRREGVRTLRSELSEVVRLRFADKHDEALARARAASARAAEIDWPPLHAEAGLRVAELLMIRGDYANAEAALEEAFFIAEAAHATDESAEAATALTRLVGSELARPNEGMRWARFAEIRIGELGRSAELMYATYLTSLAGVQHFAGKYDEQRSELEQAVEIQTRLLGPDHPQVAAALDTLSIAVYLIGDYAEARALHGRARAVWEGALGPDHPDLVTSTLLLGRFQFQAGEYEDAMATYERARVQLEATLGPDHPDMARPSSAIARVHFARSDLERAEEGTRRAIALIEPEYGSDHPEVANLRDSLGSIHWMREEYGEARAQYELALAIFERRLGAEHPRIAGTLNNLGNVEFSLGHYGQAEVLHRRAIAIETAVFGGEHIFVATALHNLGDVHAAQGRFADARVEYERALAIRIAAFGPEHPHVAETLFELGTVDEAEGDNGQARARYQRAITIVEAVLGPDNEALGQPLLGLSNLELHEGHPEQALALAERALKVRENGKSGAFRIALAHLQVARSLWAAGRDRQRARALAEDALAAFEASGGQAVKYARETRQWLATRRTAH